MWLILGRYLLKTYKNINLIVFCYLFTLYSISQKYSTKLIDKIILFLQQKASASDLN